MATIIGTEGDDTAGLVDTPEDDSIFGLGGDDIITISSGGNDSVDGGAGVDALVLSALNLDSHIFMAAPTQTATGYSGSATWGNQSVTFSNIERFFISTGPSAVGNNVTGDGDDRYHYFSVANASIDTVDLGGGIDLLFISFATHNGGLIFDITSSDANGYNGRLGVTGAGYVDFRGIDMFHVYGTKGNDVIHGREHDDDLRGGGGNDELVGNAGNDVLAGQDGADNVQGGDGNDRIDGGSGNDILDAGAGDDVLTGGASNTSPAATIV